MSIVGLNHLARDLEHAAGLRERFDGAPDEVLAAYTLTADECDAVRQRDAAWLLAAGMNPVALRNLMVSLGVAHDAMYPDGLLDEAAPRRGGA
ncbi:hypothetical protein [Sinosporangium siamense]|uniref:Extradiol ring-cleavage dioxygenase LigAB LigA subunit domain-containing protein n=1 Tax=Sinosporangium siamense TaxID=1367973 RepID=A0A919RN50_9ACTN|nr:hypothetical protein [Sinosporangium siamense]GII95246.1 hypothetical protein Ssi02_54770 [Sinosporangium siamense]